MSLRTTVRSLASLCSLFVLLPTMSAAQALRPPDAGGEVAAAGAQLRPVSCPADLDLGGPHRTAVQVIDGVRVRWQEYDLDQGQCTILLEPELRAVAADEDAHRVLESLPGTYATPEGLPTLPALGHSTELTTAARRDGRTALDRTDLANRARVAFGRSARTVRRGPDRSRTAASTTESDLLTLSSPLIYGPDDRLRVLDTTTLPFNTVVYVESEFPNGDLLAYSGVLVGPYTVLTAASALYQSARGGWAVAVEVAPGQTQERDGAPLVRPYGSRFDIDITVTQDWVDTEDAAFEYGAVFLEESFPGVNRFMSVVFDTVPQDVVNIAGYDASASGASFTQWTRSGPLVSTDSVFFDHRMDNDAGSIGAPAWEYWEDTGARRLFGLDCCVDQSTDTNVGVRFTSDNEALIADWMAFEPADDPGPGPGDPEPLLIGGNDGTRFAVTVRWRDFDGNRGVGQPWTLTLDTGYFYFFDPDNVELVVKVLDGCGINDRWWFFAGGLTNVEVEIVLEDLQTGLSKSYFNPLGAPFQPIQDTKAFATCR